MTCPTSHPLEALLDELADAGFEAHFNEVDAAMARSPFGAARSGGRSHEGVDMFAPEGTPLVAVTDGTTFLVENVDDDIGGISLWIRGANGDTYYYAHNSANVIQSNGVLVRRGQVVAYVGRTGNAIGTQPHVHFEIHPGGSEPENPTAVVATACG